MTININREELAWASGLFDGEGSSFVKSSHPQNPHIYKTLMLFVAQSGPEKPFVLTRFQTAIGGLGKINGPYQIPGKQPKYQWVATSFEEGQAVVALLWNWLGPVKRGQAKKALQQVRVHSSNRIRLKANLQRGYVPGTSRKCTKCLTRFSVAEGNFYFVGGRPRSICKKCDIQNSMYYHRIKRRLRAGIGHPDQMSLDGPQD